MFLQTIRIFLLGATIVACGQAPLTTQEQRGRQIYEHGTSASGAAIEAALGGDARVPAAVLPCVNCHGPDGQGKAEGGVVPSTVTWEALTKPYGIRHPDGRTHPPYNERSLKRAITMGLDPAGNALSAAMPRFQLSMADANDLIAYIRRLGQTADPGVSDGVLRLGVILPFASAKNDALIRNALVEYFAGVNAAGGVFDRRIELEFTNAPSREFFETRQVFAAIADFSRSEREFARILNDETVPTVAVVAQTPSIDAPLNRYVFYLDGGLDQEIKALRAFASENFPEKAHDAPVISTNQNGAVGAELVLWRRPDVRNIERICTAAKPVVLIPGSVLDPNEPLTAPTKARIFVAFGAAIPPDKGTLAEALERVIQDRTMAGAELMTEALKVAGRNLSRMGLLAALESFRGVQTTVGAPLTFGPNRRIGADSAEITALDPDLLKFVPARQSIH